MSDEKDETKSATQEPETPEVKKTLPMISKNFVNKDTGAKMTLVHNPNTGIYAETITTIDGKVTKTTHAGISHAWGKFEEVKK
jgi:hypothetical protein